MRDLRAFLPSFALLASSAIAFVGAVRARALRRLAEEAAMDADPRFPEHIERATTLAFAEAGSPARLGFALALAPVIVAGVAALWVALARRPAGGRVARVLGPGCLLFACLALAGAWIAGRDHAAEARAAVARREVEFFARAAERSDCDACAVLDLAIQYRGLAPLQRELPGFDAFAARCVREWLDEIERTLVPPERWKPCWTGWGDEAPVPEEEDGLLLEHEATNAGLLGRLMTNRDGRIPPDIRRDRLEALLGAPLALDAGTRARAERLLAAALADGARPPSGAAVVAFADRIRFYEEQRARQDASLRAPSSGPGAPVVRFKELRVAGALPHDSVRRVVERQAGRFRVCYERGLRLDPALRGDVHVAMVIGSHGKIVSLIHAGSDLPDATVVGCVLRAFGDPPFPIVEEGVVQASLLMEMVPAGG
jgi:hypothetical protein